MEIETEVRVATFTLEHRHVAQYLMETDPLDRVTLLLKSLEAFTPDELTKLEAYLNDAFGPIDKKADALAICQLARELQKLAE